MTDTATTSDSARSLEEQARALLATLTAARELVLVRIVRTGGTFVWRCDVRAAKWLDARGLVVLTDNGYMRGEHFMQDPERWHVKPTDLGRAVARLLASEVTRG